MEQLSNFEEEWNYVLETSERYNISIPTAIEFLKLATMNNERKALQRQIEMLADIKVALGCTQ